MADRPIVINSSKQLEESALRYMETNGQVLSNRFYNQVYLRAIHGALDHMVKMRTNARALFASRLDDIRTSQGLPATTLATLAGIRAGTPGYIVRTKANVQLTTIASLARALEVAPISFFCKELAPLNFPLSDEEMLELFRQNVQAARTEAGISKNALAKAAGLHPDYVWRLERAGANATLDIVESLASTLNVVIPIFFKGPSFN